MATVTGILTFNAPGNSIVSEVTVRVWDEDFRSRELLSEVQLPGIFSVAATYTVEYSSDRFQQAEAHTADVSVEAEATTPAGKLFGASEITFNARDNIRIDVVLQPVATSPEPRLSELEQLLQALEPIRQGVEYADFTLERDVPFAVEELVRKPGILNRLERIQLRQRLQFLRSADQLASTTQISLAAFYGWFRKDLPTELDELLNTPTVRLREALQAAIAEFIIPSISIDEILEQLYAFQFESDRLVTHLFIGQLLNTETGQPLSDFRVRVLDQDADPERQNLGEVLTEGRGLFEISFVLPTDAPEEARRNLRLIIQNEEGEEITNVDIVARPNQQEVEQIRIQLETLDNSAAIEQVVSPELTRILNQRNIRTLTDVLRNSDQIADLDTPDMRRLVAHAKLSVVVDDVEAQSAVLAQGYTSLLDIALDTRANVVDTLHERLGSDAKAAVLYEKAQVYKQLLENTTASLWLGLKTEPDDDDVVPIDIKQIFLPFIKCGCQDCDSAVSPLAYLADLLSYILKHLKNGENNVTLTFLSETFHKPFGELPAACEAVDKQVRQVRTCIEALRGLIIGQGGIVLPDPQFEQAQINYIRTTYLTLLNQIGVGFNELRLAQPSGEVFTDAELNDPNRQAIAQRIGINVENLVDIFLDIYDSETPVGESALEQIFGLKSTSTNPLAEPPTPLLQTLQLEHLQSLWQDQDWIIDDYSNHLLPIVNPLILTDAYFREPLSDNPAFALFQTRNAAVEAYRQQLIQSDPQTNGLVPLIESELGQQIDQLRLLANQLRTGENAETSQQQVEALHLSIAGFIRLMAIDTQLQEQGSLDEAVWQEVFNILTRAHVVGTLYPEWISAEENQNLLFGPKLFWFPVDDPEPPAIWLATGVERQAWHDALEQRNRPPLIDTNNLTPSSFSNPPAGQTNPALSLWSERENWLSNVLSTIRQARLAETTASDRLQAALAASELGISTETLDELTTALTQGQDIQPRLDQLSLTKQEYNFLAEIHALTGTNATIASTEWEQVDAILGQMRKRREYADWHQAEQQAGITLRPDLFELRPEDESLEDTPQSQWLIDLLAYRQWADLLEARINQEQTIIQALQQAVSTTEEITLPLLRDAYILRSSVPGNGLEAKADRLAKLLLTDTKAGGCQMTTRVSEAINTLQLLLWGVRTGQLKDTFPNLSFDDETDQNFDRIWQWMGSYATWKSAMQVFLFPENIVLPTLKPLRSHGFSSLIENLPPQITPEQACQAGHTYADYFYDICNLDVQASCQVLTPTIGEGGCDPIKIGSESRVHLFALAPTSRKVYTASFSGYFDEKDTLNSWHVVPDLGNVLEIIGAVPHETPQQQRLILLFVKVRQESRNQLKVLHFDLDAADWVGSSELNLPPGAEIDFSSVALQKRHGSLDISDLAPASGLASDPKLIPTILAIRTPEGRIFVRSLDPYGMNWAGSGWIPLVGSLLTEKITKVCALIQRSHHEYLMIVQWNEEPWYQGLKYRIFSTEPVLSKDDAVWRRLAKDPELLDKDVSFSGAFFWPKSPDTFVFYRTNNKTQYSVIKRTFDLKPEGLVYDEIREIEGWLDAVVGVSLEDFHVNVSFPVTLVPGLVNQGEGRDVSPWSFELSYSGNLFELLTLTSQSWNGKEQLPFDPDVLDIGEWVNEHDYTLMPWSEDWSESWYLDDVKEEGIKAFKDIIPQIRSFFDERGEWKLADWYVREFADGKGLASAVEDAFNGKNTTFRYRGDSIAESIFVRTVTTKEWEFIPSGGDEEFGPNPHKAIAFHMPNGAYRMKMARSGDTLSAPKNRRITPRGLGPFDIAPQISAADLQQRKDLIQETYEPNGGAPPSVLVYLHEAYRDVPLYLALQLQHSGYYQETLDWFRLVYDYTQKLENRKIDYSLVEEEELEFKFDRAEDWLDDATNPHAIAVTRSNTYTRFVLISIIRCLLDYADAEFTFDTAESLARARTLYDQALALLESPELNLSVGICDDIIGTLQIDVIKPWDNKFKELQLSLAQIKQPDRLRDTVAILRVTASNPDLDVAEKFQRMQATVSQALAEAPPSKLISAVVEDKSANLMAVENKLLSHESVSRSLIKSVQQQGDRFLANVSEITGISEPELETAELSWLRSRPLATPPDDPEPENGNGRVTLTQLSGLNPLNPQRTATLKRITAAQPLQSLAAAAPNKFGISQGLSFDFCVPPNPILDGLRLRATLNLYKLRNCLNIAGMQRQVEPYAAPIDIESGLPLIGASGNLVLPGLPRIQPTPYRSAFLFERAKQLVNLAQQMESAFLSALANAEQEEFARLQAQHSIGLAQAKEKLQRLRVGEARQQIGLAVLQQNSALVRATTYAGWIAAGASQYEQNMLQAYKDAGTAQENAAIARATGQAASAILSALPETAVDIFTTPGKLTLMATIAGSAIAEGAYNVQAIQAQTSAQTNSLLASLEEREKGWRLQQSLAAVDVQIGNQQIQLAQSQLQVVGQEHTISQLEVEHAKDTLTFLYTKFLDEELYRWMSDVLENVYRYFLQQATAVAKLAENQVAFERLEPPAAYIQTDYWNVPDQGNRFSNPTDANADRRGLTGSARLLQDLYQLEQYAIDTNKRKLQLSKTFDLAQLLPLEFQRFRETGVLVFPTPMELFDRDFPGHYLRLISQVRVSVVALIPPTEGIKATLTSSGISRVVIGGDIFQTQTIRRQPEQVALTSSINATGVFELDPQSELLRPFEGTGVDTFWKFCLARAANRFNFNTIATVLVTIDYTALDSYTYRQQVLQKLDRNVSFDRAFSFRNTFADAWYDLNNPDQTATPMVVQVETHRGDFPPNIDNLRIQHVVLHFVRTDLADFEIEIPVSHLLFTPQDGTGTVGGGATTIDGTSISTRRGNGISWTPMIGMSPFGTWELAFPDAPEVLLPDGRRVRDLFETEEIVDILFVITYAGQVPEYPA